MSATGTSGGKRTGELIRKAAVLIEALPYIQRFRNEIVVVKLGGSAMEDKSHVESVLRDVAFMECVGMRAVVVHGGGKAISRGMDRHGIKPSFVRGHRVTCERTIRIVEQVMKEELNPYLVSVLGGMGANAVGMNGEDVLRVVRKTHLDEKTGELLDWGFVGEPGDVDTGPILSALDSGAVPVMTPLGRGPDGKVHNVNADSAAAAVAKALHARKLVFLSDVPGVLRDPEDETSLLSTLKVGDVERLVQEGVISGGMLPKIQGCIDAVHAGVRKVHMVDGRMPHSILLEVFTDEGVGTEIM
ncbi:MAG: acetylglutamate kinase [Lentisphaerae bacterium]|nr:acetylglutamate kinase [Lentisphaerota bacterium]